MTTQDKLEIATYVAINRGNCDGGKNFWENFFKLLNRLTDDETEEIEKVIMTPYDEEAVKKLHALETGGKSLGHRPTETAEQALEQPKTWKYGVR